MEVIRFGTPNAKPPLLFVHGSYCAAWIWEKFFLPYFAQQGWHGAAISLRGHGKSEGVENIASFGISAYLEDVRAGIDLFDKPPVLLGHSLGGYLIQKYALEHKVEALVLLCAPSLLGLSASAQHIAFRHPDLAMELGKLVAFGPANVDGRVIGTHFFSSPKAADERADCLPLLQQESSRFSFEASWPDWRRPVNCPPTLVLGGEGDAFVPVTDLHYETTCWHGDLKILPNVPHGIMLDPCWPTVADEIITWLDKNLCA